MSFTKSDRGFKQYKPIPTDYGHEVLVYESSAASRPMLWLAIELTEENARARRVNLKPESVTAHLSFHQTRDIIAALQAAMENHYQHYQPPTEDPIFGAQAKLARAQAKLDLILNVIPSEILEDYGIDVKALHGEPS